MTAPHLLSWSQAQGRSVRSATTAVVSPDSTAIPGLALALKRRPLGDRWPECRPLTDAERDLVHALIDELADERQQRRQHHEGRLERVARSLGRQIGRGDATVAAAS